MTRRDFSAVRKALDAQRRAQMAALGAQLGAVEAMQRDAATRRAKARNAAGGTSCTAMAVVSAWQAWLETGARQSEIKARELAEEVEHIRRELARSMGRLEAVDDLIARAERAAARTAEQRAADVQTAAWPRKARSLMF